MAILIKLSCKTTCEVKPPRTLTRDTIKQQYLAIGKQYGIKTVPSAYIDLFRTTMPTEYINHGGAPRQNV